MNKPNSLANHAKIIRTRLQKRVAVPAWELHIFQVALSKQLKLVFLHTRWCMKYHRLLQCVYGWLWTTFMSTSYHAVDYFHEHILSITLWPTFMSTSYHVVDYFHNHILSRCGLHSWSHSFALYNLFIWEKRQHAQAATYSEIHRILKTLPPTTPVRWW